MKNFQRIAEGVNTAPLFHAVQRNPSLWNSEKLRTTYPGTPHAEVDDIWLRWKDQTKLEEIGPQGFIDLVESINYPAILELPQARPLILDLARAVEGCSVGHVVITRLPPGKRVAPHEDAGKYATLYDRYHVILQSLPGCVFQCGEEKIATKAGDVWWFDNSKTHSVINNSSDDRITMIVDVRRL